MTNMIRIEDMNMYFGDIYAGKITEIIPYYTVGKTNVVYISYVPEHSLREIDDKPILIEITDKDKGLILNVMCYSKRSQNLKVLVIEYVPESSICQTTWNH